MLDYNSGAKKKENWDWSLKALFNPTILNIYFFVFDLAYLALG